jgi:Bacterial surface proteins containing Ig-like domains
VKRVLAAVMLANVMLFTSVLPVIASEANFSKSTPTTTNILYSKKGVKVTKVILNKKSTTINVGSSEKLIPTISPATATNKDVIWNSNQPKVATVDSNGNVTGVKVGTAVITVVSVEGKKKTTCLVKVVKANDLTISSVSDISQTVNQDQEYLLPETVEATMSDGTKKQVSVTWNPTTVDTSQIGEQIFNGSVSGYSKYVKLTLTVIGEVSIKSIVPIEIYTLAGTSPVLPETGTAIMTDSTEKSVAITWDAVPESSYAAAGTFTLTGTIAESDTVKATATVTVDDAALPNLSVTEVYAPTMHINVGQAFNLPAIVYTKMSDGILRYVPVTWNPSTVDTSQVGEQIFNGSVLGYSGQVTLTVIVEN